MNQTQPSRLLKWALVFGIAIVLNMFFNYALSLAYVEPAYPQSDPQEFYENKNDCVAVGGQWTQSSSLVLPSVVGQKDIPSGYCDPDYTARMQYEAAHKAYQRTVFIVLSVLGIIALIAGTLVTNDILSLSFSWGGVLSLLIASMRYWSAADNVIKVLILGVALGALIWVAVKKFGK